MPGFNVLQELIFSDGITWLARVPLPTNCVEPDKCTLSYVAVLKYIKRRSRFLVPEVYHYALESDPENLTGTTYVLMERLPGHELPNLEPGSDDIDDDDSGWSPGHLLCAKKVHEQLTDLIVELGEYRRPPADNIPNYIVNGPLMERLPNRALPDLDQTEFKWARTLPLFLLFCGVCSIAMFNYQKSTSPTVESILYALRTNSTVREVLGDEIYFASKIPWISGELAPLQGRINISFWVKGTKGTGQVKFVSGRKAKSRFFETTEWSLKTEDGTELQLLELGGDVDVPISSVETKTLV
ncbi:hypothetical protein DV738_g731, partial [Chaetothyriales sp. CBS 135597]